MSDIYILDPVRYTAAVDGIEVGTQREHGPFDTLDEAVDYWLDYHGYSKSDRVPNMSEVIFIERG